MVFITTIQHQGGGGRGVGQDHVRAFFESAVYLPYIWPFMLFRQLCEVHVHV